MYFATQATNICDEKENHKYYRKYKKYVRRINRQITWLTGHGKTRYEFRTANKNSFEILEQIGNELIEYGYHVNVYTHKEEKKVYNCLEILWGHIKPVNAFEYVADAASQASQPLENFKKI